MSSVWESVLIPPSITIKEALRVIDTQALRIAIVVNDEKLILGVVYDGDIRRGILAGVALTDPVTEIMNSNPLTADIKTPKIQLFELMQEHSIFSIPLVTNGKVVGLETLHENLNRPKHDNPVLIMAGGFGTRLEKLTANCPKPMLKVGDRPMLENIILGFIKAGFNNFYISTHFLPEKIKGYFNSGEKWNINIQYIHENSPLGTAGALGMLPKEKIQRPLILINGDILTKIDFNKLLEFHEEQQSEATMCVRDYDYQVPFGVVEGEGTEITTIIEKPIHRFFINAGIYVINPSILHSLKPNTPMDIPSLFKKLIGQNKRVLKFPIHEYWLDIGQLPDYSKAQIDIQTLELNNET
ncbi:nucleotidyltransferase family protein [Psychrobium sp. 1_MG-2023]|uniref:nucleotidyltransferase family protein n=1 Tax=Psychrobium sp. 1_MG-2023 TaxID=3062624 RepID=UPI000C32DFD3|nr:nucleotidyltransferase family protein [Psychrobium sp. 1_MG-2023]MDP2559850.1 nucleotidyltransferase family protein [Psychrobium sp. 1_MG-2023]PKF59046.1 alcohol dehydrogenase [Alteromonadales bacterium alter-6D02]